MKKFLHSMRGKLVEIKFINKRGLNDENIYFYHGKLLGFDKEFVVLEDFKDGKIGIKRNDIKTVRILKKPEISLILKKHSGMMIDNVNIIKKVNI